MAAGSTDGKDKDAGSSREQPLPSPLKLTDTASEVTSAEQQLRKRPAPVDVPGHAGGGRLIGRTLTGYSQGSSSFPPAGESGATSADGRLVRGTPLKGDGGSSPWSAAQGSPKLGGDSSPRTGNRRAFQPLDLTTARKIELMQSVDSNSARQQNAGAVPSVHAHTPECASLP